MWIIPFAYPEKIKASGREGSVEKCVEFSRSNRKVCDNAKRKFVHWIRPLSVSCSNYCNCGEISSRATLKHESYWKVGHWTRRGGWGEREIDFAMGIIWITVLRVAASWKICLKSIREGV